MNARIEKLLAELTLDEKAALVAGRRPLAHGRGAERLGIPALKVTDGPSGARGERWIGPARRRRSRAAPRSARLESGARARRSASGSAARRGARARTCCSRRRSTSTGIRSRAATSSATPRTRTSRRASRSRTSRGVQSQGVGCTVKHFVANDSEFERMTISSEVDERTLREISLVPFEAAVREAGTWAVMTAYNRVHGTYCSEHAAARRAAARRVGLRRRRHVGLVRHAQHRARGERGARPRDAGPAAVVRREARGGGARRRGRAKRSSTTRSGGC